MRPEVAVALAVGVAASTEDLLRRQVSNWIPASALVAGVAVHAMESGWPGVGRAALGCVAGFLVFLVFYVLGGMGGGDVKLMAGFGAVLGAGRLLEAALWTAACGGVLALLVLAVRGARRLVAGAAAGGQEPSDSIPYAPAITLGAWLSLIPKG